MSGWMLIGDSWALRAILAIPEAIRLAQTSCARSRRDGRHRETALCALRSKIHSKPRTVQHGPPPGPRPGGRTALSAHDPAAIRWRRGRSGIGEAGAITLPRMPFYSPPPPVGAPQAIPPQIPFACGPIPRWGPRNRPAAVRRSGIRNRWRGAPGWRPSARCC